MTWFGAWLVLTGCLRDVARGPDLGACADTPEGTYGFGEAGIGTCIAGPAGLTFFEQDGRNWLAVTNADPFRLYLTGSVLVIDWDALDDQLSDAPTELPMDQVAATALPIVDDDDGDGEGGNPFLGDIVYLPDRQVLVSPGRYSEAGDYDNAPQPVPNSGVRSAEDDAWVVDTSGLSAGTLAVAESIQLQDDPFPIAVDATANRIYVGNLTDHSVSVLDVEAAPIEPILTKVDVAPGATTTEAPLDDADGSGTLAEVSTLEVLEPSTVVEDDWTLTYVEQTAQIYVAAPIPDTASEGVKSYSTGDTRTYIPSVFPVELGLGQVNDPFVTLDTNGLPTMFYARAGVLYSAVSAYDGGAWYDSDNPLFIDLAREEAVVYGSPSVAPFIEQTGFNLYCESRPTIVDDASILLVTSTDLENWAVQDEVLVPPPGTSYENPFVALDPLAGTYRMWLTIRVGEDFDIGLAESEDGITWTEPVVVLASDDTFSYAAPALAILEGPRYGMWLSRSDGARWDTAYSWSYDGWHWTEPVKILDGLLTDYVANQPPRPAVFVANTLGETGGWRLLGANTGSIAGLLHAGRPPSEIGDYQIGVAHGHVVSNDVIPDRRAQGAILPGSAVTIDGRERLYVSVYDVAASETTTTGTARVAVLDREADDADPLAPPAEWQLLVDPDEMDLLLGVGPGERVSDPLIAQDEDGYVLFYTLDDGETARMVRATSDDGIDFTPLPGFVLGDGASEVPAVSFDSVEQRPHALESTAEGIRVWYTAADGSTVRIGAAIAPDLRGTFARERGPTDEWRLGAGEFGAFDGAGVRAPVVVSRDGVTHLYYAGSDGTEWRIGHRTVAEDGTISEPRRDPFDIPSASLSGRALTFSEFGVDMPVLLHTDDNARLWTFAFAGYDATGTARVGEAQVPYDVPDEMFARMRFPTAGDGLEYGTNRGGPGAQVIELGQATDTFSTLGHGMSSMTLDDDRGFLYVTSKLTNQLFVLDVRDDSNGSFVDANYLDLEAVLQIDTGVAGGVPPGFRDVAVARNRDLLYVTQRAPDALLVVDPTTIVDDGVKQLQLEGAVAVVPLQSAGIDAGADTNSSTIIGGDGMALSADEQFLYVTQFRGNALSVFDLDAGAWSTEVAFIDNIGENPHRVRLSPDGRYAVVANYLGEVVDSLVYSNLAIVDLDPTSDRYLEVVTWLVNR